MEFPTQWLTTDDNPLGFFLFTFYIIAILLLSHYLQQYISSASPLFSGPFNKNAFLVLRSRNLLVQVLAGRIFV